MGDFIGCCEKIASRVQGLLEVNKEWVPRYVDYSKKINDKIEVIKNLKKNRFHEWAPLYVYMTISEAKGQMKLYWKPYCSYSTSC